MAYTVSRNNNNNSSSNSDYTPRSFDDDNIQPPVLPQNIHIVTWYMSDDALSFAPLVHLLASRKYRDTVQRLEFVTPGSNVSSSLVDQMAAWIELDSNLQEVILYKVKYPPHLSGVPNPPEGVDYVYLRQLEEAAHQNPNMIDCTVHMIERGNPDFLCDSLSTTVGNDRELRHLALDGKLLQGMSKARMDRLVFDLSWDRSTHVALFKDVEDPALLEALLPKLSNGPLHTLKLCYDPYKDTSSTCMTNTSSCNSSSNNSRTVGVNVIPTQSLKEMMIGSNKRLKTLQRLYFGNCYFNESNMHHLIEAIVGYIANASTSAAMANTSTRSTRATNTARVAGLQQVEFCLCQFESGTGSQLQELVRKTAQSSLQSIQFQYPIYIRKGQNHSKNKAPK